MRKPVMQNSYANVTGMSKPKSAMAVSVKKPKRMPTKPTLRRAPRGV